jgi:peptidoglycan/xylan/chitin deacetylase (PgdA/CDA1 family)
MSRAVHIAKTLAAWILVYSGALPLLLRLTRPRILVLAYHRVTPDVKMPACAYPAMHVSTSSFEAQLLALRRLYRVVPMSTLHAVLQGREELREHLAVVTFDDGYRDNYQQALPILAKHGIPATFFLSLAFVEGGESFWFDRLADAVQSWDHEPALRSSLRETLPQALVSAFDDWSPLSDRLRVAAAYLKTRSGEELQATMAALGPLVSAARATRTGATGSTEGSENGSAAAEPLTWHDVRAMRESGMNVGAHGVHHSILTAMPPEAARAEIQESLAGVTRRLGAPVAEFAYPNGDADEAVASAAAEAGVRLGFTMQPHDNRPGDDLLRLGRRNVCEANSRAAWGSFSRAYFWCEITGVFDALLHRSSR